MNMIYLLSGETTLVDEVDYEWLNQWKWDKYGRYAVRRIKSKYIYMHRLVNATPDNFFTDHINGDGLDNRKSNLRTCTHAQNMMNRKVRTPSGYKGVYWNKRNKKWIVIIRQRYYGLYQDAKDAAKVYDRVAAANYGEFASLNFPFQPL